MLSCFGLCDPNLGEYYLYALCDLTVANKDVSDTFVVINPLPLDCLHVHSMSAPHVACRDIIWLLREL